MLRKSFSAISTNLSSIEATVLGTKSQRQSVAKILRITRSKHDHISRNWESSNRQTNVLPGTTAQSKREILCSKLVRYSSSTSSYSIVQPGRQAGRRRTVPDHIQTPPYYQTGQVPTIKFTEPELKSAEQIKKLSEACQLARQVLNKACEYAKVGVTTDELDSYCHDLIVAAGAYPSPLNYKGFPKSICTSVNNCACHGIPDDRKLEDGDVVNIDITVYLNGYHGDCSETVMVGNVDEAGKKLVSAARECMYEGISICGPNVPFYIIGMAIDCKADDLGYSVVPNFAGHGIGEYFHGPPDIYHFANESPGVMKPGMTFTVEPILSEGGPDIRILSDGWTALTSDNARTAQFEHTVLVTTKGVEILT